MLLRHTTVKYIWTLRERIQKTHNRFLKKIYYRQYNQSLLFLGSYLPLSATFEERPVFPHGLLGVFISQGAKIGRGCTIFHHVTIGSNTLEDSKSFGAPVIGDNVYIGCGAKIIGGVSIGNNVRIGANCVVTTDIADNSTVVLEKPRIIAHATDRDNTFKKYEGKMAEEN